jgi:transketolase
MLATANVVASNLVKKGLSVRLLSMHTIKPLDREAVIAAATQTKWVVTLEEHSVEGGLGGAVAEVLAEMEAGHAPLKRIGLRPEFNKVVGDQKYLKSLHGLDEDGVMKTIEPLITRSYGLVS